MDAFNKYLISIIIPVYNVEKYLVNTINSIIEQTIGMDNIEVILIDDNSNDKSKDIINKYVKKYKNFKGIFCQKTSGFPGKPRNIGLNLSSSEFIMFLDSDDYLENNACEILYNKIIETKADIVCGAYTTLDSNFKENFNKLFWLTTLTNPNDNWNDRVNTTEKLLSNQNFELIIDDLTEYPSIIGTSNVWGKIFKKSLFEKNNIRFPEDRVAEDSVFLLNSIYNASRIVFIKNIILHYNNKRETISDLSMSHTKNNKNLEGRISSYLLMYNLSVKHDMVELFAEYLLSQKINYWFNSYLLRTKIDDFLLYELLNNYQILFKLCYYHDLKLTTEMRSIFKDICDNNFDKAIEKVKLLI